MQMGSLSMAGMYRDTEGDNIPLQQVGSATCDQGTRSSNKASSPKESMRGPRGQSSPQKHISGGPGTGKSPAFYLPQMAELWPEIPDHPDLHSLGGWWGLAGLLTLLWGVHQGSKEGLLDHLTSFRTP